MNKPVRIAIIAAFTWSLSGYAQAATSDFNTQMQQILNAHYNKYKDMEYFSGVAVSIYIPRQEIKNYYVGRVAQDANSKAV